MLKAHDAHKALKFLLDTIGYDYDNRGYRFARSRDDGRDGGAHMEKEAPTHNSYSQIMLEHMDAAVALFDAQDFRLLSANKMFLTFLKSVTNLTYSEKDSPEIGDMPEAWFTEMWGKQVLIMMRSVVETGTAFQRERRANTTAERGVTYWNWIMEPIYDDNRQIIQLLFTATEVTDQVLVEQQAEQVEASLLQKHRSLEAERQRLSIIETVARSIRASLDIETIGRAAIEAIITNLHPKVAQIHTAHNTQKALQLLYSEVAAGEMLDLDKKLFQHIPYNSPLIVAQAYKHRHPIVIENAQLAANIGQLEQDHLLVHSGALGFICIPLWFKDHFEGALSAMFPRPILQDSPEIQVFVSCSTHIAAALAQARLHSEARHEHDRLQAILDQLPEAILIFDAQNASVSYANAASERIIGVSTIQQMSFPVAKISEQYHITELNGQPISPEHYPISLALRGEIITTRELLMNRPDGRKIAIMTSAAPIRTESGKIIGAITAFQDISERKAVEQHKNEFFSIASHELRTPITSIQGFSEILQMMASRHILNAFRVQQAIIGILKQSQYLTRLVEDMLDVSRIEEARLPLYPATHDLLAILTDVIASQAATTRRHQLHLILARLQPSDVVIGHFDEDRMVQVLNNLISNAIKYSPDGGEIEIGLRLVDCSDTLSGEHPNHNQQALTVAQAQKYTCAAMIWVKDHGIGIAVQELALIFERFHRAYNQHTSIHGLGIGLYLVKELVTAHNGHIWVESTEGQGSTFYMQLPLYANTTS